MFEMLGPLHPKVVHFPIALFITALILELLSFIIKKDVWNQSALILYTAAALFTPIVARTGMWEVERIGLNHPVLNSHRQFALWTMWIFLMSLPVLWFLFKECRRWLKPVFISLLIAIAVCVILTNYYGGRMVYEYGVGTELF